MLTEVMANNKSSSQSEDFKVCNVISLKMWPIHNRVPTSTSGFIDAIKMVRSWRKRAPDKPETKPSIVLSQYANQFLGILSIEIFSSTGYTRCGIFLAANLIIDQMDLDGECDFFHACKVIRLNRPQLIDNKVGADFRNRYMNYWYLVDSRRSINICTTWCSITTLQTRTISKNRWPTRCPTGLRCRPIGNRSIYRIRSLKSIDYDLNVRASNENTDEINTLAFPRL